MMKFKVGFGYDVHQMREGRELWLGGVKISHTHGAFGHSDADVLIHAISDALLGAAGLRDIGFYFSDKDSKWKGIDSKIILKEVFELLKKENFRVGNIDSTLCLEEPKIGPYVMEMRKVMSSILEISEKDVTVKATTNENMGFVGRKEGVTAYAVALIYSTK